MTKKEEALIKFQNLTESQQYKNLDELIDFLVENFESYDFFNNNTKNEIIKKIKNLNSSILIFNIIDDIKIEIRRKMDFSLNFEHEIQFYNTSSSEKEINEFLKIFPQKIIFDGNNSIKCEIWSQKMDGYFKYHRIDGPSVITYNKDETIYDKLYYLNNRKLEELAWLVYNGIYKERKENKFTNIKVLEE